MANPKPVLFEGVPVVHKQTPSLIDVEMPNGTRFMVESSNALLIDQIAKLTKGRAITITIAIT